MTVRHRIVVLCMVAFIFTRSACAEPTVSLFVVSGPDLSIAVGLSDLAEHPVAGYQVILSYDPYRFTFVSGQYLTNSFGLTFLNPIGGELGTVRLAAGVNTFAGQQPLTTDATVAILRFVPAHASRVPEILIVSDSLPPTRLSDVLGQPIVPITLVSLERACAADYDENGEIAVPDIFAFLSDWFSGSCKADINGGGLSVPDIFAFLSLWFARCP
jgi:hypothetical protein